MQNGLEELSPIGSSRFLVKHAGLDDFLVHVQFVPGGGQNSLFDRPDRHQTQNAHFVRLPDTMGAILGLQILVRIPIGIENDDSVGRLEIEAQTAGASRQQEKEIIRRLVVETLQQVATIVRFGRSVQSEILKMKYKNCKKQIEKKKTKKTSRNCYLETLPVEIVFHDGHELRHLAKEEDAMVEMFQFGQDAIEQFEFARRPVEVGSGDEAARDAHVLAIGLFDVLEHEGVIAELPQLHDRVHQGLGSSLALLVLFRSVRQHHAFALHVPVEDLL